MSSDEPLARRADKDCRGCRAGLEHCHGTVIHHALRWSECTEEDCVTPEVMHTFTIDCEAIGCTCAARLALAM